MHSHVSRKFPSPLRQSLVSERRKQRRSQTDVGKEVGLPQMHISAIENGRVVPRADTLADLARVLGFDLMLVPRELVPTVEAMIRDHSSGEVAEEEGPLYTPDGDE